MTVACSARRAGDLNSSNTSHDAGERGNDGINMQCRRPTSTCGSLGVSWRKEGPAVRAQTMLLPLQERGERVPGHALTFTLTSHAVMIVANDAASRLCSFPPLASGVGWIIPLMTSKRSDCGLKIGIVFMALLVINRAGDHVGRVQIRC